MMNKTNAKEQTVKLKKTYEGEMHAADADADADLFLLTYSEKDTWYNNKYNRQQNFAGPWTVGLLVNWGFLQESNNPRSSEIQLP